MSGVQHISCSAQSLPLQPQPHAHHLPTLTSSRRSISKPQFQLLPQCTPQHLPPVFHYGEKTLEKPGGLHQRSKNTQNKRWQKCKHTQKTRRQECKAELEGGEFPAAEKIEAGGEGRKRKGSGHSEGRERKGSEGSDAVVRMQANSDQPRKASGRAGHSPFGMRYKPGPQEISTTQQCV